MLEVQDLNFSYDGKTQVLRSIDFQLSRGEIVTITGPTGSGKSTFAKCLTGFIPRSIKGNFSGSILIDNEDVSHLSIPEFSKRVSLVQQDPDSQICTLRVSDEIAFGPENYGTEPQMIFQLVENSLTEVDSQHLFNRPTYGISGGEKQRVCIASMLSCQSKYLILDEPSASLDPRGVKKLQSILLSLKEKHVGVICIEHNLGAVRSVTDRILSIIEGKISEGADITSNESKSTLLPSISPKTSLLSCHNISYSYGPNRAVNKASVEIHPGEIIALMGANGSGKSTLLALLSGLLPLETGQVYLNGISIQDIDRKELTKTMSIVFQNPNHQIFEKTVWKEQILTLEIGRLLNEESTQKSNIILEHAGIAHLKHRNPFSLSHGQKRRLNISSGIAHDPAILLFDEPFIGQDYDGRHFILNNLTETANKGGAAVVVTHNPFFVKNHCNRAVFMENGTILLDGVPDSVFQQLRKLGYEEFTDSGEGSF